MMMKTKCRTCGEEFVFDEVNYESESQRQHGIMKFGGRIVGFTHEAEYCLECGRKRGLKEDI